MAGPRQGRGIVSRRLVTGAGVIRYRSEHYSPAQAAALADPKLLAAISRIGNNLNQIARAANRQQWPGEIDLLHRLINIHRALRNLAPSHDD